MDTYLRCPAEEIRYLLVLTGCFGRSNAKTLNQKLFFGFGFGFAVQNDAYQLIYPKFFREAMYLSP